MPTAHPASEPQEIMTSLNLHIGGTQAHPDWKILDIEPRPEVDFVGNASDLSQFADGSVDQIYASHVLEHFCHHLNNELMQTLGEWFRVLKPGGRLLVSVPDMRTLCWLYLTPNLQVQDRMHLMAMMFGGQHNEFDLHKVGLDIDILGVCLQHVGFVDCEQVPEFNLFEDSSRNRVMDLLISLNVIASKPLS